MEIEMIDFSNSEDYFSESLNIFSENSTEEKKSEKVEDLEKCEKCDFHSKTKSSLYQHVRYQHHITIM